MKKFTVITRTEDYEVVAESGNEAMNKVCKIHHILMSDIEKVIENK